MNLTYMPWSHMIYQIYHHVIIPRYHTVNTPPAKSTTNVYLEQNCQMKHSRPERHCCRSKWWSESRKKICISPALPTHRVAQGLRERAMEGMSCGKYFKGENDEILWLCFSGVYIQYVQSHSRRPSALTADKWRFGKPGQNNMADGMMHVNNAEDW